METHATPPPTGDQKSPRPGPPHLEPEPAREDALVETLRRRSGPEVLELLRAELELEPEGGLDVETQRAQGRELLALLSAVSPPQPSSERSRSAFVNVIGSSHARAFGAHPHFFPVELGAAASLHALTERQAEIARRRFLKTLPWLDRGQPTLVALGDDARLHHTNALNTRGHERDALDARDLAAMSAVAARYAALIAEIQPQFEAPLHVVFAPPTLDPDVNRLAEAFREVMHPHLEALEVGGVLVWDEVIDSNSGLLSPTLAVEDPSGSPHLSSAALPMLVAATLRLGILAPDVDPKARLQRDFPRSLPWQPAEPSPGAASEPDIAECALEWLAVDLLRNAHSAALLVNVKDGWLPARLPIPLLKHTLALADSRVEVEGVRRRLRFHGRPDRLVQGTEDFLSAGGHRFPAVVVTLHPATLKEDLRRAEQVLEPAQPEKIYVIAPDPEPAKFLLTTSGRTAAVTVPLHGPQPNWHRGCLLATARLSA